jgi:acetyltransferase
MVARISSRRRDRRLADPGTLLATTHEVGGGVRVRMRLARPSDAPRVAEFLDGLSPETLERRFLVSAPGASEPLVRRFTFYDPRERLVVAATSPAGGDGLVGLADLALLSTGLAEVGVVVDDAQQGRGVGRLLTEAVAALARRRGATHLKAVLLEENAPMLALMERLGPTVRTVEDGNSIVYTRLAGGGSAAAA